MTEPLRARLPELAHPYLEALAQHRPALARLFAEEGTPLLTFLQSFAAASLPPLQDRSDYTAEIARALRATQGEEAAARAVRRLERSPVVYTANHLCLESMSLTVQSMLLAGLAEDPAGILPVEACGLIPADNASYPSGLLLDRTRDGKALRLPIFDLSKRERRRMTMGLPGFTSADLHRARARVDDLRRDAAISAAEGEALHRVLWDFLGDPDVLSLSRFRDQAERANARMWSAWFDDTARADLPPLAYLTSEPLRTPLLLRDLSAPDALAGRLVVDRDLREQVLHRLEGVPCCWSERGRSGGTAFFWAVTDEGRTSPLWVEGDALVGETGRIPLEASALQDGLVRGALVPSIFLNLSLGLARGLVQVGGFSQLDYLARMQRGLSEALAQVGQTSWAARLATPLPPLLTAGLSGLAVSSTPETVGSAGSLSFIARGGLSRGDLDRVRALTLTEALLLELPGLTRMVVGDAAFREIEAPDPALWTAVAKACLPLL